MSRAQIAWFWVGVVSFVLVLHPLVLDLTLHPFINLAVLTGGLIGVYTSLRKLGVL